MELYILRHGIAEDLSKTGADSDRQLTPEGRRKTAETARALAALGVEFDKVLSSPYARAWQTAEIVVEELGCPKLLVRCEELASGEPMKALLAELREATCASLLIVGHEPDLSRLISVLLCGTPNLAITMKKGGLARLSFGGRILPAEGRLDWLLAPKHLGRLG
jgi:phosphohistidine phosphatase